MRLVKIIFASLSLLLLMLFVSQDTNAQVPAQIKLVCREPYEKSFGSVTVQNDGNINAIPCPTKSFQINGITVNPSGGGISGGGTTGFMPVFTSPTAIGNTLFRFTNSASTFLSWTNDTNRGFGSFLSGGDTVNRFGNAYTYIQTLTNGGVGSSRLYAQNATATELGSFAVNSGGSIIGAFTTTASLSSIGTGRQLSEIAMQSTAGFGNVDIRTQRGRARLAGVDSNSYMEVSDASATGNLNFFIASTGNGLMDLNNNNFRVFGNGYSSQLLRLDDNNNTASLGDGATTSTSVTGINAQLGSIGLNRISFDPLGGGQIRYNSSGGGTFEIRRFSGIMSTNHAIVMGVSGQTTIGSTGQFQINNENTANNSLTMPSAGGATWNFAGGDLDIQRNALTTHRIQMTNAGATTIASTGQFQINNSTTANNSLTMPSAGGATFNFAGGSFGIANQTTTNNGINFSSSGGGSITYNGGDFQIRRNGNFTSNGGLSFSSTGGVQFNILQPFVIRSLFTATDHFTLNNNGAFSIAGATNVASSFVGAGGGIRMTNSGSLATPSVQLTNQSGTRMLEFTESNTTSPSLQVCTGVTCVNLNMFSTNQKYQTDSFVVTDRNNNDQYISALDSTNILELGANTSTGSTRVRNAFYITHSATVPTTATDACTKGEVRYDSSFLYLCTATNTWRRATLASW